MNRRLPPTLLIAALVAALAPAAAPAKGPVEAALEGPGLEAPVPFGWMHGGADDDPRRAPFEHVALATGLLTAVFADASAERFEAASRGLRLVPPPGDLGPKYTLTHRFEGPGGVEVVQDVYPYAEPRPVLFIAPRSWFVAGAGLRQALVGAGLPPDSGSGDDDGPWSPGMWLAALGALAAAAVALATRRRPRTDGAQASA
jgi:hypothetical protein